MTPASHPAAPRSNAWLPTIIVGMTVFSLVIGFVALRVLEARLLAATGDSLALAASGIAEKLDLLLYERYGDIQVMTARRRSGCAIFRLCRTSCGSFSKPTPSMPGWPSQMRTAASSRRPTG